jgi:Flp pilus assembly protein TadG
MICTRRSPVRRRALTLVETSVVALVCFLFMFALFEFGRAVFMLQIMTNAARQGARTAVVIPMGTTTPAAATQTVNNAVTQALAGQQLQNLTITIFEADANGNNIGLWTNAQFGQNLVVRVEGDYGCLFPTFNWLPNSGAAPNSTHLVAEVMMRGEAN